MSDPLPQITITITPPTHAGAPTTIGWCSVHGDRQYGAAMSHTPPVGEHPIPDDAPAGAHAARAEYLRHMGDQIMDRDVAEVWRHARLTMRAVIGSLTFASTNGEPLCRGECGAVGGPHTHAVNPASTRP